MNESEGFKNTCKVAQVIMHDDVLQFDKYHTENKMDLYLSKFGNKYFKYWKFGWPNLKCHNIISFLLDSKMIQD